MEHNFKKRLWTKISIQCSSLLLLKRQLGTSHSSFNSNLWTELFSTFRNCFLYLEVITDEFITVLEQICCAIVAFLPVYIIRI